MPRPMTLADSKSQEYDLNNPFPVDDPWTSQAIRQVFANDGAAISVTQKKTSLLKFGENEAVGTSEAEVMTFAGSEVAETLLTDNLITHFSSTDAGDAVAIEVQGHTISGNDLTAVTQTVTLVGQTKTALTTPLARVQRVKNAGATNLAGDVHVYEDVAISGGKPTDDSKNHIICPSAENQTLKAKASTASDEYLFVTSIYGSINKKTAGYAILRFKTREPGGVWQTKFKRSTSTTGGSLDFEIKPYFVIPPNTDIALTAEADSTNTPVAAGFNTIAAKVTSFPQAGTAEGGGGVGGET